MYSPGIMRHGDQEPSQLMLSEFAIGKARPEQSLKEDEVPRGKSCTRYRGLPSLHNRARWVQKKVFDSRKQGRLLPPRSRLLSKIHSLTITIIHPQKLVRENEHKGKTRRILVSRERERRGRGEGELYLQREARMRRGGWNDLRACSTARLSSRSTSPCFQGTATLSSSSILRQYSMISGGNGDPSPKVTAFTGSLRASFQPV